jgi:methylated-DNA-[protein]-cysteine S-methyltransferase
MSVPYGETTTYGAIARQLDNPNAVRAVGGAVGQNPWSIMTPCHRVIGASGALTGYAGGLSRKIELLRLEGVLL